MTKSKHDLANVTISILVDFDKKSRFSISILRSSQHYKRWPTKFNSLFSLMNNSRATGHSVAFVKNWCHLDLRRHFFSRVTDRWNRPDQSVVPSNAINAFKSVSTEHDKSWSASSRTYSSPSRFIHWIHVWLHQSGMHLVVCYLRLWVKSGSADCRSAGCESDNWQWVKSGKENAGENCGITGNKREYKMQDLIAMTARRHERNADDVLYHKCSHIAILSK